MASNEANKFVLNGNELRINRPKPPMSKSENTPHAQTLEQEKLLPRRFSITDIYYGTLITGAAMRNIQNRSGIVCSNDEFGVIGHPFQRNKMDVPFTITLDPEKRRIVLVGETVWSSKGTADSEKKTTITERLLFEWGFKE